MPNQRQQAAEGSYTHVIATALSDSDLSVPCRAFIVLAAGNLKLTTVGGSTVTIAVTANTTYPIACTRLWSTGSTATLTAALR